MKKLTLEPNYFASCIINNTILSMELTEKEYLDFNVGDIKYLVSLHDGVIPCLIVSKQIYPTENYRTKDCELHYSIGFVLKVKMTIKADNGLNLEYGLE